MHLAAFPGRVWERVLGKVKRAVVFMDDPCSESLHWSAGGAAALLEAGARNVKRFSSFESGAEDEPKAVFVVSTLLKGRTADVIKDIVSLSRFQYCVVFTAVPHYLHLSSGSGSTGGSGSGGGAESEGCPLFERFEEKLCEWMGDMNYTAEVTHAPLVFARLSPQLVLAPAFADLFPLLERDLEAVNEKRPEKRRFLSVADVDAAALPAPLQVQMKAFASALDALLEFSNTREESFAVGPMSRLLAAELAGHPQAKNRRKTAQNKASVVFIDRTLDLTGVGSVNIPLKHHLLNMFLLNVCLLCVHPQCLLCPPCLGGCCHLSATARLLWEMMLVAKQKEAVMEVRRQLVEAASKENLPIKMSMGRVTAEQLSSYVQLFRGSWEAVENHCGVLQLGLATAHTLRHPALARWDACLGFERLLLQALGNSGLPDVLRQLLPLIKSSSSGTVVDSGSGDLSVDELLVLLVYVYSLAQETKSGFQDEEQVEKVEGELIGALTLLLNRQTTLSPLLQDITGVSSPEELTTERAHTALERVFETLRGLGRARDHLKQLRSVYSSGDGVHQATYRPFLKQVLEEIFNPNRPECPDIEHTSGGLTDLLKTGFSMFMKVNRPHPSDHPLLILVLVGGVTPSELRLIRDVVSSHKVGTQVLVVSTRLLRPNDVPHLLFNTNRLSPDVGV
uniref:Sec1 family domain containing 2 n=1 Tax=Astyanax mexicanus TaxID=7994 RepID=A0A3B1K940_ASTMX